ncbi:MULTISPECIES: extracellular solute-binding protein [Acinetobacter]|uniref:extracellular solute-binding protein n=1 Tax=Acinetobacter TaxID=469 RepID=UPI0015D1B05E|nr:MULTISPECIES: extracellular solute-binding protein [Acinetobacter]MCP0912053.1 extracellular solute-binding protein [Acinetobacter pseudolwoffii]MDM1324167.1 ABC transporter substrate-binding protein [Acinetobacter pseudolwoffii]
MVVPLVMNTSWAALITTPYIALHSPPKYSHLQSLPYANPQAPKGGALILAADGSFDNLNSMNGKGNVTEGINYIFDSLLSKSLDEPGVYYPLLAEKVSFDPKKTTFIIFHLNPKARFSNGQPVTAEDVKYSFELYQTQSNFGLQMYLADLNKLEVLSALQVKMHFKSGHNPEMAMIVAQMPIYSKRQWQGRDFKDLTLKPILGSGPYVIERIDPGRSISYQRNPQYWGKNLLVNRGRYNFDRIQYRYYRSPEIKFEAFKSGQFTLHEEKQVNRWIRDYQFPAVRQGQVKRYRFRHQNPVPTQSLVFNTRRQPFADIRFRQALSFAYDFEWLNKAMFYGEYQRLNSFFSNSELASRGRPSAQELQILKPHLQKLHPVQRQAVLQDWQYPQSDASGFNRQNLLKARQLLLKAGYRYQQGQLVNASGQAVKIEFLLHQVEQQRHLMPYLRHLKRLGIQANIRMVETAQYYERLRNYQFDMIVDSMPQSLTPGQEQKQFWSSQAAKQVGNYNYAGIQNPAIDAVIKQVIQAQNREQVIDSTRALDRLLRAGYYHIPTYGTGEYWYAYWNMYQQPKLKPKLSAGIDYWWVDAAKAQRVANYFKQH